MLRKVQGIIWVAIFLFPQWQTELMGRGFVFEYAAGLEFADSLYSQGDYKPALDSYKKIIEEPPVKRDAAAQFRIAYAAYQSGDYSFSAEIFKHLALEEEFLSEYSHYFYLKNIWLLDEAKAAALSEKYVQKYRRHAFSDSLILPIADYYYSKGKFIAARNYYRMAKQLKINKKENARFLYSAAEANYKAGNRTAALKSYYQIVRKYPSKDVTLDLVKDIEENHPKFFKDHLFDIVNVYTRHRHYNTARTLLEDYLKGNPNQNLVEKARYMLTKIYYQKGQYSSALYGFNNLLNNLQNKSLEPHLRIYIARCNLMLGRKQKAIELYEDYANRYPRRRLAAEAVWKAAWLAEEINQPEKAIEYYHMVYSRWPRSTFAREAYFREGFTHYRYGRYQEADKIFTDIRFKKWADKDVNRGQYWSSLCREQMQDTITARRLRVELAENLWDDYYTMRSYLWEKQYIDSTLQASKTVYPGGNPLLYYGDGISQVLNKIEDAFQLRLLLGAEYGKIALSDIKFSLKTKQEWIALAEVYKKFGDYGRAYEVYDLINNRFYSDISYVEKSFMLKERFPYYYDTSIENYSKCYGVEKELILAVIKQESTFKAKAQSWANAHGLMQLIPSTAEEMAQLTGRKLTSVDQLYDSDFNIRLGSRYLKRLNYQFRGKKEQILAAYNAGPHRVKRWSKIMGSEQQDVFIENIEFSETRDYVRKVMKNYWAYKILNDNLDSSENILFGLVD